MDRFQDGNARLTILALQVAPTTMTTATAPSLVQAALGICGHVTRRARLVGTALLPPPLLCLFTLLCVAACVALLVHCHP